MSGGFAARKIITGDQGNIIVSISNDSRAPDRNYTRPNPPVALIQPASPAGPPRPKGRGKSKKKKQDCPRSFVPLNKPIAQVPKSGNWWEDEGTYAVQMASRIPAAEHLSQGTAKDKKVGGIIGQNESSSKQDRSSDNHATQRAPVAKDFTPPSSSSVRPISAREGRETKNLDGKYWDNSKSMIGETNAAAKSKPVQQPQPRPKSDGKVQTWADFDDDDDEIPLPVFND